jgi:hypothetical protein
MDLVFGATNMPRRRRFRNGSSSLAIVAAGDRLPQFFGKNDECGFLPKAATPGWK